MSSPLQVSILICAHNEELKIGQLLVSLAHQTFADRISEILLVDNASTDQTVEVAKNIAETYQLPLSITPLKINNIGSARKHLITAAKEDFVAFVDADCKVDPRWLQTLIGHYSNLSKHHAKVAGVGGPHRLPGKNLIQKIITHNLENGFLHGFSAQAHFTKGFPRRKDHLPTTNAFFSKKSIIDAGNFSEYFSFVGEDLDLGLRLRKKDYELFIFDTPQVINDCADGITDWTKRMFRFGIAQGLTFGRRFSFVTLYIISITLLIVFLLTSTTPLQPFIVTLLLLLALITKPLPMNQISRFKISKYILSFVIGIFSLSITCGAYYFGFLAGLFLKLKNFFKTKPQSFSSSSATG
ncbi:MAG: glycosyltransferase [Bdellovibrionales bacterium]|nr:glycosyltransferase [Bdellovibrionales bacterium]